MNTGKDQCKDEEKDVCVCSQCGQGLPTPIFGVGDFVQVVRQKGKNLNYGAIGVVLFIDRALGITKLVYLSGASRGYVSEWYSANLAQVHGYIHLSSRFVGSPPDFF